MTSVIVDAMQLTGQSAYSGIGTYVRGLLGGLGQRTDVTVRAMCTRDAGLPDGVSRLTVRRHFRQGRPAVYEHEVMRTIKLKARRADLFHNPNPHAPRFPPSPWVQTLHDIIPLVMDDPTLAATRRRFQRYGPRYATADAVIAVSRFAADQGIDHLGIPPSRITVIHHGVSPEYSPGPYDEPDPPYITVVSEYSPRKRFSAAFEVIGRLADNGLPHRLKVAGRVAPWAVADFDSELARAPRPDRVDILGFVADLPSLYRGALAHLVTSRHEGFGLTALEAMSCGVPVVAFANSALPEVVDGGGILVPDGDVPAAAAALESLARSANHRSELAGAALARSRDFSWATAAERHAEVYLSLCGA